MLLNFCRLYLQNHKDRANSTTNIQNQGKLLQLFRSIIKQTIMSNFCNFMLLSNFSDFSSPPLLKSTVGFGVGV